ncbi:alpha/beta fold hydrolase [Streptomyces sp. NPDC051569]|uniref:alpha/beta fold hydrolase n=1 Tax=Streptomyces sp. NPDC051569 TaxID=3365661 RepID=UPI003790B471
MSAGRPTGALDVDRPVVPSVDAQLNDPDPLRRARFDRITVPTRVIAGGGESRITQENSAWTADRIRDARPATIEAGHLVHAARPGQFLSKLREFGI